MPVTENKIRKELRTMKKMIVAALSLALLIFALALCACGKTPVEAGREKLISAANKKCKQSERSEKGRGNI